MTNEATSPTLQTAKVTGLPVDGALMLYAAPTGHSEKVTAISPTAKVTVHECVVGNGGAVAEWCAVSAGSKSGWAPMSFLQF